MTTSFYTPAELRSLGLKRFGQNVFLSRKTSLYNAHQIEIGDNVRIDDFCILSGQIRLGNYIHVGAYSALYARELIVMGNYTGLSARVCIYTVSEDYLGNGLTNPTVPARFRHPKISPVTLEPHVIVGAGSVILPGVTIGEGAAIGALSLVMGSIRPWRVATGNPARPVAERRRDLIQEYQQELEASLASSVATAAEPA